jgi:amidase
MATDTRTALTDPLHYASVCDVAAAIRRRELSSEDVVRVCLERIETVNGVLNAVVALDAERALDRAREADAATARGECWGPLHGVPMTIKDSLDTAGLVTTGGTTGRRAFVPATDATVVARLRRAGAVLLGKTNTPEFTLSFETDNRVYGRTSNPYDPARTSGGSSGGAGAIVAAGGAPFDIGSDYGGSVRVPAHSCGIAGIKPTSGRVPRTGHVLPFGGLQDWFQQIGPLARYVDDLALLLPLIAGPDHVDPAIVPMPWHDPHDVDLAALKIALHTDNGVATPTAETRAAVEAAASVMAPAVLGVETARPAGIEEGFEIALTLMMCDGGAAVRRLLREAGTTDHTLQAFTESSPLSAEALDALIARWYAFRSRMHTFMADFDAIICPVNANPALPHGSIAGPNALAAYSYTATYNATGWPAAVVRAGTSPDGLPIGVQIVARPGREDVALALARIVETGLGGFRAPAM